MASVFNRTNPIYYASVHTPDFDPVDWAINPDITLVVGQPVKYWELTGGTNAEGQEIVDLKSQAEQDAIDAAEAAARETAGRENAKTEFDDLWLLRAFAEVVVDEINLLRAEHSLPARTPAQLRTALRNKIDNL